MLLDMGVGPLSEPVSGRHWDPDEVRRQVAVRIHSYQAMGFAAGDRALIHFGNQLEFFAELLAIWAVGGCAIPVDMRLTPFEVNKLIDASRARFQVINDETPSETAREGGIRIVHTGQHADAQARPVLTRAPVLDDDALILFTSGSTGDPKGVVHTHRSLRARWVTLQQSLGLEAYRRTLCILPTHFGHGLICNCLFPWLAGCHLFITPPFKPELIMRLGGLLDEHRISFMSSVPSVWNLALKAAPSPKQKTLQRIHVGSAPLSRVLWQDVQNWAGINEVFNAYGITETGSWVAGTTGGVVEPENGLIGQAWGATIKVLHARDTEASVGADAECAAGEEGMIWLNTPALMKGYFQRQDLTDAVIHQGWFMTGDIGIIDESGRLLIRGRERDEINKGGMKVFPADVDAVVEQFPAVQDVCTFGFADDNYGENVGIAVVLNDPGAESMRGLQLWIAERLAEHKRPVRWYLIDDIPRTSRGKINRATVMESCAMLEPTDIRALVQNETKN